MEMSNSVIISIFIRKQAFDNINSGEKTIEGRCKINIFMDLWKRWENKEDNEIIYAKFMCGKDSLVKRIISISQHDSFDDLIDTYGLKNITPYINSVNKAISHYRGIYTKNKEKKGIIGIVLDK